MDEALSGISDVKCNMDDMVVEGEDNFNHIQTLEKIGKVWNQTEQGQMPIPSVIS